MTAKDKWKEIQAFLSIAVDGIPGSGTANAVAESLGISWNRCRKQKKPGDQEACLEAAHGRSINKAGLELVKHFESCLEPFGPDKFVAYRCPAGVPTIGWGTIKYPDGEPVKMGDIIDQEEADALLAWEVNLKAEGVEKLAKVPLTDDQFSALVSFAYNVGLDALKRSTLLKKLNASDIEGAAAQFKRWNKGGGRVLRGLVRRRKSEERLFRGMHPAIVRQ